MDCLAKFDRNKRKLMDGKFQQHRCFAASVEAARSSVRVSVDRNWEYLKRARTTEAMTELISRSLPQAYFHTVRVHVHGDYYNLDYMLAWLEVARKNPDRLFYSYTKSLNFLVKAMSAGMVPSNFVFTASRGGKFDALIEEHGLREAVVVMHPEEAEAMGLKIDKDESLATNPEVQKFALLIHGQQPSKSRASQAILRLKREDIKYSYGRR